MKHQKKGTFNRMKKFRINEISPVDKPAQDGAKMTIMKRVEKKAALTDPMDGHAHLLSGFDEHTSGHTDGLEDGSGNYHSHPWIVGLNGEIIIGAANGHTHRVGFLSKQAVLDVADETKFTLEQLSASSGNSKPADDPSEENMTDEEKKLIADLEENLAKASDRADRAENLAKMSDVQRAYHAKLEGEAADEFAKSENKEAIIKNAELADPVVCVTEDGVEVRKSQDPTGLLTAAVAKAKDDKKKLFELKEKGKKDEDDKKSSDLKKRATDLDSLPGSVETKVEMLKSLDSIEDESVRKAALQIVTASNTVAKAGFEPVGAYGSPEVLGDDDALDAMANELLKTETSLTFAQAYDKILDTEKGQEIYNKRLGA